MFDFVHESNSAMLIVGVSYGQEETIYVAGVQWMNIVLPDGNSHIYSIHELCLPAALYVRTYVRSSV